MAFCTRCGAQLVEGEVHTCPAQRAAAETASTLALNRNRVNLDFQKIFGLVRNPFMSTQLTEHMDISYGIWGLIAAVIGVVLWLVSISHNLTAGISKLPFIGQAISPDYVAISLLGIVLVLLPNVALFLLANWQGQKHQNFRQTVTTLGATQWIVGVGFVIAAILSYLSISISLGVYIIAYQADILILTLVSLELFMVPEGKRASVIILSQIVCAIVWGLIGRYVVSSVLKNLGSIFSNF